MSTLEVNKITPQGVATEITLGDSGDTFTVPTGVGVTVTDEVKTNKISPASGTSFTMGDSGDTFTIPSGVTLTNNGTASGFGKINQVLQGQNATQISTSTHNSNFDITSISITPTSTSSKILLLGVVMGIQGNNNSANTRFDAKLYRGGTNIMSSGANFWTFNTDYWRQGGFAINWLDSPSTTSATTFYLKGAWLDPNGGTCYVNKDGNSGYSTLTVMEVLV